MVDSIQALQLIKEKKMRFPLLIWGEEVYLRDRIKKDIINSYLEKRLLAFNYQEIKEDGQGINEVLELLINPPILSPYRILYVHLDIYSASEINQLAFKLSSIPPSPSLFIGYSVEMPPKELLKVVSDKGGMAIKVAKPPLETLRSLLKTIFTNRGKTVSPEALELLTQDKRDLQYIRMEIEKILLNSFDKNEVTLEDMLQVYTPPVEEEIFPLLDSLFEGKVAKSLRILGNILSMGESPSFLLSRLASQVRNTYKTTYLDEKETGFHPYMYRKLKNFSRKIRPSHLESALLILALTDEKLKSGKGDPMLLVNQAFLKIGLLWQSK